MHPEIRDLVVNQGSETILTRGAAYTELHAPGGTIKFLRPEPKGTLEGTSVLWILWRNDQGKHQRHHDEL